MTSRYGYSGNFTIKGAFNGSNNQFLGSNSSISTNKTTNIFASLGIFSKLTLSNLLSQSALGTDSNGTIIAGNGTETKTMTRTFTNTELTTPGNYTIGSVPASNVIIAPQKLFINKSYISPYGGVSGSFINIGTTAWTSLTTVVTSSIVDYFYDQGPTSIYQAGQGVNWDIPTFTGGDPANTLTITIEYIELLIN